MSSYIVTVVMFSDVIRQLLATVVREELKRREAKKEPVLDRGSQTKEFIKNWLIENDVPLTTQLGMHDGPPLKFLTGVFIATSTSKKQVPFVQDVIQADGAHMSFGKYTLFSAQNGERQYQMMQREDCGISQRRHTTCRHHCDGNVYKI